jgi:hypothetical protein
MTRTIFLITSIAVTALAVAVPSAFGNPPTIHDHGDATQAKLVAQTPAMEIIRDHGDATQAKLVARSTALEVVRDHGDATQAKLVAQSPVTEIVRDHGDATQAKLTRLSAPVVARENAQRLERMSDPLVVRDHGDAEQAKLDAQSSGTTSVVESTSGWELDWSQLAIGFGIGIVLTVVLGLSFKATRPRTLAH